MFQTGQNSGSVLFFQSCQSNDWRKASHCGALNFRILHFQGDSI
jgi:hypothetical protein